MDSGGLLKEKRAVDSVNNLTSEFQDNNDSPPTKTRTTPTKTLKSNPAKDRNGISEASSHEDMTSHLESNEVLNNSGVPPLIPQQQQQTKQPLRIPPIILCDNRNNDCQSLSTRTREKSDSSVASNQLSAEEIRKEINMLFQKAQLLSSNGNYSEAILCYEQITNLNEKSAAAWIAKGHCHTMLGQDLKALATYEHVLKAIPSSHKDEQLWYGIGSLYQKLEEWNNAEISFRNALRLEPSVNLKAEILYSLGMVLKEKSEYAESVKMLTNSILTEVFPPAKVVEILCQSGELQEKMNDETGALKTYQYALVINENHLKALLHAGWLSFQLDKPEQALSLITKADHLIPNDANINYMIARCHLKLKRHTTAYDYFQKCIQKEPSNAVFWSSLGILFCELTQFKQGYECLSKALKYNTTCAEHFFNLGCLFELNSQQDDAVSMYEKAIEAQSSFTLASERKNILVSKLKTNASEVQFKHPHYVFPFEKTITKEKPMLPLPKTDVSFSCLDESLSLNHQLTGSNTAKATREIKTVITEAKQISKEIPIDKSLLLKSVPLDLLARKLGSQKVLHVVEPKGIALQDSLGADISTLKLSRPLVSESSGIKLPSVRSLNPSVLEVNSFSILQNNFNNVNNFLISSPLDCMGNFDRDNSESEQTNVLVPTRAKTDDSTYHAQASPNNVIQPFNSFQGLFSKKNGMNQDNGTSSFSISSLKVTKNISSPIVLKHNPQGLLANESYKKIGSQNDTKVQNKVELNVSRRFSRSDNDDEEPAVEKKVKLQFFTKGENVTPTEN